MEEDRELEEQFIDRLAERIKRMGLVAPAIFFLEAHKPLSFIGGQVLYFSRPFLGVLFGFQNISLAAKILSTPGGVEKLLKKLEE
ncbi:hypothetical protein H5T87_06345 [bacterium]|nr:hypothetical protein [bacterium]